MIPIYCVITGVEERSHLEPRERSHGTDTRHLRDDGSHIYIYICYFQKADHEFLKTA